MTNVASWGRAFLETANVTSLDQATNRLDINASNRINYPVFGRRRQRDGHANTMEQNDEDDDIKLAKASAGLLADLESCLPKVLWKPSRTNAERGRVHSHVRRKDLDYIINLVC